MRDTGASAFRFNENSDNVAVGAASAQTQVFGPHIDVIRVVSTTNCWINIGTNPTAANADDNLYLPANVIEYFRVAPGQRLAVIQDSAAGTINVSEMTR